MQIKNNRNFLSGTKSILYTGIFLVVGFIFFLQSNIAYAATPAFDAATTGDFGDFGASVSITHTAAANSYMLIWVGQGASANRTFAVTVNGNSATSLVDSGASGGNRSRLNLFVYPNPLAGSNAVIISITGNGDTRVPVIVETYTNVASIRTTTSANKGVATSGAPTLTVTSAVGELVVDGVTSSSAIGAAGAGQTERATKTSGPELTNSDKAGASSVTMSWASPGDDWAQIAVSLQPAGTFTSTQNGNWNIGTTWGGACSSSCVAGTDYPDASDFAQITTTNVVTVTANQTVNTLKFLGASTAGVVKIDSGITLTVTNSITMNSADSDSLGSIVNGTGAGTLVAGYVVVGHTFTPTSTRATKLEVDTSVFTLNGALDTVCTNGASGSLRNDPSFIYTTGTLTASGKITICSNGASANNANGVIKLANGSVSGFGNTSGTLVTSAATPFSVGASATSTFTNSTVEYSNASDPTILNTTYTNLKVSGTVTGSNTATVAGILTVTGTLTPSAGTITMNNGSSIVNSGTLTFNALTLAASSTVTTSSSFGINSTLTVPSTSTFTASAGTITINAVGFTVAATPGAINFSGLTVAATPTAQPSASFSVGGVLTVSSTKTFSPTGTVTLNNGSSLSNAGTLLSFANLTIASAATVTGNTSFTVTGTLTNSSTGTFTSNSGTVTMNNGSTITNSGTLLSFNSLTIASGATVTANTTYTVAGTLTISSSATLAPTSGTITLSSTGTPLSNSGSFIPTGSNTVNYTGNGATATANTYFNVGFKPSSSSPTVMGAGTYTINGTWTIGDGTNAGATASANNPTINVIGSITIAVNATYTKGTGVTTFKAGTTQTLTDNTTSKQDLGTTILSSNSGPTYAAYRAITIDHTKVPNTDQTDFPVLISGTYTYLKTTGNGGSVTNASGYDVAFFSDSNLTSQLKHETEKYTAASGAVIYWVKVPTLSSATDTVIYMAYGNSSISTDQSDRANTWNSAFKAVYHFGDGTTLDMTDSTGNGNTLTNVGATAGSGQVNGGLVLNGSSQYAWRSSNTAVAALPNTLSSWFFPTNGGVTGVIVGEDLTAGTAGNELLLRSTGVVRANYNNGLADTGNVYTLNAWNQGAAAMITTASRTIYANGGNAVNNTSSVGAITPDNISIGGRSTSSTHTTFFPGTIDEVRISNVARSADWTATEYNSIGTPSSFYSVGSEVLTVANSTLNLGSSVKLTSLTINTGQVFSVNGSNTLTLTGSGQTSSRPLINSGTFTQSTGTVQYTGTSATDISDVTSDGVTYNNLTLASSGTATHNLGTASSQTLTVSGTFTVGNASNATTATAATYSPTLNLNGNVSVLASSTFVAPSGNLTLTGDLTNNGTFTHNSGTVLFVPSGSTSNINGTTGITFNNFTVTSGSGAGKALTFKNGNTYSFAGALSLAGTAGRPISIKSASLGSQWTVTLNTATLSYVFVQDSACSGGNTLSPSYIIYNGGNNGSCWGFYFFSGTPSVDGGGGGGTPAGGGTDQGGAGGVGGSSSGGGTPAGGGTGQGGSGGAAP